MGKVRISEGEDFTIEHQSRVEGSRPTTIFHANGETGEIAVSGVLSIDGVQITPSDAALAETLASNVAGQGAALVGMQGSGTVQTAVTTAQTAATAAGSAATAAAAAASAAQTTASTGVTNAATAQSTANAAGVAAAAAQSTANDAASAAATALNIAQLDHYFSQDLPDADTSIDGAGGTYGVYYVRAPGSVGTYTANHDVTLDTVGAIPKQQLIIATEAANGLTRTMTVINGGVGAGTLLTFDVTTKWKAIFIFDGTNWFLDRQIRLQG